jgi:Gpi18-like mannosyltransferase
VIIRVCIIVAAIVIRLLLLPGKGFPDDLHCFAAWMHALVDLGPRGLYLDTSNTRFPSVDYPPAYLYVLWVLGEIERAIFGAAPPEMVDRIIEKLPATIADFFLAWNVAAIAERFAGRRAATQTLAVLLLSPVLWFISAYWGQVDVIAALGLVLAIRAALNEQYLAMWALAAITVLIKPQPVVALPMLWIFQAIRSRKKLQLITGPLLCLAVADLLALPAAPSARPDQTLAWLLQRYTIGISKYPNDSSGAFNLYTIFGNAFSPDAITVHGFSLHSMGVALAVAFVAASIAFVFLRLRAITLEVASRDTWPASLIVLIQGITMGLLALFLFMTRMHERYEMSAIVLLPLIALFSARERIAAITLGSVFCINALFIIVGFYGGHHHPQIRYIVHGLSLLNIAAFLMIVIQAWQNRVNRADEILTATSP